MYGGLMNKDVCRLLMKSSELNHILFLDKKDSGYIHNGKKYDAVVINLLQDAGFSDALKELFDKVSSSLENDGEICVVFGNKYSYQKIIGGNNYVFKNIYSLSNMNKKLKRSGFSKSDLVKN
jgi:hypothetical protein